MIASASTRMKSSSKVKAFRLLSHLDDVTVGLSDDSAPDQMPLEQEPQSDQQHKNNNQQNPFTARGPQ